jgi:hypothetical protein
MDLIYDRIVKPLNKYLDENGELEWWQWWQFPPPGIG